MQDWRRRWHASSQHGLIALCLVGLYVSLAGAELKASQLAILINRSSLDSVTIGHHYAERRGVPTAHIIALDLGPVRETISRQEYDRDIVAPVRQALAQKGLAHQVRALVTVYGIPLRVLAPWPDHDEKRWSADALERQKRALLDLQALAQQWQTEDKPASAPDKASEAEDTTAAATEAPTSEASKTLAVQAQALFGHLNTALHQQAKDLEQITEPAARTRAAQQLTRQVKQVGGLAALLRALRSTAGANPEQAREAMQKLQQQVVAVQAMVQALRESPSDTNRQRAYWLIERAFGLQGVFQFAAGEQQNFTYTQGDASVDSELSLLWWDSTLYRLSGRVANPLYHTFQAVPQRQVPPLPGLMVSRLDAPTPALAMRLVDQAMSAEQAGLHGKAYLDARGIPGPGSPFSYDFYDQNLRDLAALLRHITSYTVVLENTEARFSQPGQAPDVALYAGWYSLRHYEDAFMFNPGAIGYHIASGEAISIHNAGESGWCKNALERGITATLGPIDEPYLDAFPLPEAFFGLLLTGHYTLAEAYYLTSKYVSWRMVLFGDPLYNPWRGRGVSLGDQFTLSPDSRTAAGTLPRPPTDWPFPDPLQGRAQLQAQRDAVLAQVERVMQDIAQHDNDTPVTPRPEGRQK